MITNDEQLTIVKEQIQLLRESLDSLEATVRLKSESQFQIFSEGLVDQLKELRDEITQYDISRSTTNAAAFRKASDSAITAPS